MSESPLLWSDSFSVGHEILDNQHKKILGICAEIDRLARSGARDFTDLLFHMNEYAKAHFLTEERLLKEIGYPDAADHEAGHQAYYTAVAHFNFSNMNGTIDPHELSAFARRWWIDHILKSDMQYKLYLENCSSSRNADAASAQTPARSDATSGNLRQMALAGS